LKEIQFFKNENDIFAYIYKNKLNFRKKKDDIEQYKIDVLKNLITDYLAGKGINLYEKVNELSIDLALREKFQTKFSYDVIQTLLQSNYGDVTTYQDIGTKIGSKASRAVGNVLKSNPLPLIIPCHRVIRKDGNVGGFMGKSNKEWQQDFKTKLLQIEGSKRNF
jgi:methylated-DNA-[protein]-cysteine S-methyltransferase